MIGLTKDQFVYLKVPKNGSTTFTKLLSNDGWEEINVYDCNLDFSKCILWGHITDPIKRHTKGLAEYISLNPDIDIHNPSVQKMLISGVFDSHTYSISMLFGSLYQYNINWIPLDVTIVKFNDYPVESVELTGNGLTNDFFMTHGLNLHVDDKNIQWSRKKEQKEIREFVEHLKIKYPDHYRQLVGNFLESDSITYSKVLEKFRKKYNG